MDTSGPYALVKARTDTSGIYTPKQNTDQKHTLHVMYKIDKHSLHTSFRAQFTRHIQDLHAHFTHVQFTPPPTRTINASKLRVQSTCPTYVYNLCLSLARMYYTSYFGAHMLHVQPTHSTYTIRHVIRLSLACTYYTL